MTASPGEAPAKGGGFSKPLDLDDPALARLIIRLALPSIAGLSITAVHHVVNAGFLGLLGPEALTAVSVAIPIFALIAALGHGIGIGAAAAIGRCLGAADLDRAGATAGLGLGLALLAGLGCSAALLVGAGPMLRLFGANAVVLSQAMAYAGPLGFGCALLLLQIVCDFIAIGEGNTRFSMWALLGGFTLNIALDPLLIFTLGFGIRGAALATILSQITVLVAYALYFSLGRGVVRPHLRLSCRARDVLRPILVVGLPTTLSGMLSAAASGLIYQAADRYGGLEAVAGIGIAFRLVSLGTLPVVGFCLGAQAVLSHGWGAGDAGRVLEASRLMLRMAFGFTLIYAIAATLMAGPLVGLFTRDETTRRIAVEAVVVFHAGFAFSAFEFVLLVLLQAKGDARLAAIVSLAPQGYLLLPLLALLAPLWGVTGLIASIAIATALTGLVSGRLLMTQHAALRRQVKRLSASPANAGRHAGPTIRVSS